MSRLLFAAARGARIYSNMNDGHWIKAYVVVKPGAVVGLQQRIHPDDAHLQYGPISTELRNYALGLPLNRTCWFTRLALHTDGDLHTLPPFDRYIFFLLMAEALADEGM
jgi:hypothetical protein